MADPHRAALKTIFELFGQIGDWCSEQMDRIDDSVIELAPDGLALYIESKSATFDFDLNRELAEFMTKLAVACPIHAILVPSIAPLDIDGFKDGHSVLRLTVTKRHAD